ncbi:MAG: chalcone isomerase family protein [Gammaproteobacteria bacterium]|jgi:hypothetical protein|nr:chalcone isomerase family protein [Gammaproteobacteria bacterium]
MGKYYAPAARLYVFGLAILLSVAPAFGNQNTTRDKDQPSIPNYQLVGQADVHWLWLKLYTAQLRTPSGRYNQQTRNLSLQLTYARTFSRDELIKATLQEWQRQDIYYLAQWAVELSNIWPHVEVDDRILLFVDSNGYSHFFYNQSFIGTVEDTAFAQAFTDIWLSENTQKPLLRQQLTGYKP